RTHKVIYRQYAGLFFSLCVYRTDNYLESVRLFVEILDHFFSHVCELVLVFNFSKVYLILDEFILAGKLQETSKKAPQNLLEPSAADIRLYEDHVYQVQSLIDMEMSLRTSKTKLLAGIDLIRQPKVSALETENVSRLKSKRSELEFRCQMAENLLGILEKLKSSSNEKWKDGVVGLGCGVGKIRTDSFKLKEEVSRLSLSIHSTSQQGNKKIGGGRQGNKKKELASISDLISDLGTPMFNSNFRVPKLKDKTNLC
ncbi:AP-2 complex subunit sigma, partial [Cucurbita argyrosperma subsp. argyrosperma]